MDLSLFTEHKSGRLVPISDGPRPQYAFLPNPLPIAVHMSDKLWTLLTEAARKMERLNGIGLALPSPSLLLRPLQRREAITSNSLEGTYVTPKELLLFEVEKLERGDASRSSRADWIEVWKYDQSLQLGSRHIRRGRPLNLQLLLKLHRVMLSGVRGRHKNPGAFRDKQVYVGADGRFIPPPADELEAALHNWESYLAADSDTDPVIRACVAHYQFEAIHPFEDGNGRIGRLWLSLTLQKWLEHSQPWLYLSEFFEKHRREYIDRLFRVSANGEWPEWLEFCLLGIRAQAEASILRCERLVKLKEKFLELVRGPRSRQIIDLLFDSPFIDAPKLKKECGISLPTAHKDIEEFEKAGILFLIEGHRRPKVYAANEIFREAYGDDRAALE